MTNIPYIAAHREKRAGKDECFAIVKKIANNQNYTDIDIATLYSYFLPTKSRGVTDPFKWAASACDNKSQYAFCKFVESSNGCLIAANTKIAHIVFSDMGLTTGFYDIEKGYAGDDVAIMPDVFSAMAESQSDGTIIDFNVDDFKILETPTGLSYVLPWNGKGVNKEYFDSILSSVVISAITYSDKGSFSVIGTIGDVNVCAIIMPFQVHGLNISGELE